MALELDLIVYDVVPWRSALAQPRFDSGSVGIEYQWGDLFDQKEENVQNIQHQDNLYVPAMQRAF